MVSLYSNTFFKKKRIPPLPYLQLALCSERWFFSNFNVSFRTKDFNAKAKRGAHYKRCSVGRP